MGVVSFASLFVLNFNVPILIISLILLSGSSFLVFLNFRGNARAGIAVQAVQCKYCRSEIDSSARICPHCRKQLKGATPAAAVFLVVVFLFAAVFIAPSFMKGWDQAAKVASEPVVSEAEYKAQCKTVTYDELARDDDAMTGERVKLTGRIFQVVGSGEDVYLMIDVEKDSDSLFDNNVIKINYSYSDSETRFIEADNITIWGKSNGFYDYTNALKVSKSAPEINARYIKMSQ